MNMAQLPEVLLLHRYKKSVAKRVPSHGLHLNLPIDTTRAANFVLEQFYPTALSETYG